MSLISLFKKLLLLNVIIFITSIFAYIFLGLSSNEVESFNDQYQNSFDGIFEIGLLFLIIYLINIYLLYNFKKFGKPLFLIITFIGFFLSMTLGPLAFDAWEYVVDSVFSMSSGAILVLLFLSPIKNKFDQ